MKLDTDTKLIIAGVLVIGVGAWYLQRTVSQAVSNVGQGVYDFASSIGASLGGAWDSAAGAVTSGAQSVVDATGGQAYTNPNAYTLPPGYVAPWYMGGAVFPSTHAYQADVRRLDNAIDAGTFVPASSGSFLFPLIDFSKA